MPRLYNLRWACWPVGFRPIRAAESLEGVRQVVAVRAGPYFALGYQVRIGRPPCTTKVRVSIAEVSTGNPQRRARGTRKVRPLVHVAGSFTLSVGDFSQMIVTLTVPKCKIERSKLPQKWLVLT